MSNTMTCGSIDDVLGPSESRYFGRGFQRVTHDISQIAVYPDLIVGGIAARATVNCPADWSTKRAADAVRPHLSTVDALVIAVQLAEAFLLHTHGLDSWARRHMWLRAFAMWAGAAAQSDLTDIGVRGRRGALRLRSPEGFGTSSFDFAVGTLRLGLEIDHHLGTRNLTPAVWSDSAVVLGDPARRHYGHGFTHRRHTITNVSVDTTHETASATVAVTDTSEHPPEGLSAAHEPTLSMVDATICAAQLAQALSYQLEGVHRDETDTLWMRRCQLRALAPWGPDADTFTMSARVLRRRRVDRMDKSWRIYDLAGDIGGIAARTALAFNVPGAAGCPSGHDGAPA